MDDDFNFNVVLQRDKASKKVKFKKGQVVSAKTNPNGSVYIMGYPSIILGDKDYETFLTEADLWQLLLQ